MEKEPNQEIAQEIAQNLATQWDDKKGILTIDGLRGIYTHSYVNPETFEVVSTGNPLDEIINDQDSSQQ